MTYFLTWLSYCSKSKLIYLKKSVGVFKFVETSYLFSIHNFVYNFLYAIKMQILPDMDSLNTRILWQLFNAQLFNRRLYEIIFFYWVPNCSLFCSYNLTKNSEKYFWERLSWTYVSNLTFSISSFLFSFTCRKYVNEWHEGFGLLAW